MTLPQFTNWSCHGQDRAVVKSLQVFMKCISILSLYNTLYILKILVDSIMSGFDKSGYIFEPMCVHTYEPSYSTDKYNVSKQ